MEDNEGPSIAEGAALAEVASEQYQLQRGCHSHLREFERIRRQLRQATVFLEAFLSAYNQRTGTPLPPSPPRPSQFGPGGLTSPLDAAGNRLGLHAMAMNPISWPRRHAFDTAPQQPSATRPGTKKPVVTLDFQLRKTSYKEQDDPKNIPRTLAYVQVQRALLKYLDTYASETLSPRQATKWTQEIDSTGNKEPQAIEALSLCYYMRAQGYEVFAEVRGKTLCLFCRAMTTQGTEADVLYWKQNLSTNRVQYATPSAPRATQRCVPRRTAPPGHWDAYEEEPMMNYQAILDNITGRVSPPPPPEELPAQQDARAQLEQLRVQRGETERILNGELTQRTRNEV
jgi:hypothetical protein